MIKNIIYFCIILIISINNSYAVRLLVPIEKNIETEATTKQLNNNVKDSNTPIKNEKVKEITKNNNNSETNNAINTEKNEMDYKKEEQIINKNIEEKKETKQENDEQNITTISTDDNNVKTENRNIENNRSDDTIKNQDTKNESAQPIERKVNEQEEDKDINEENIRELVVTESGIVENKYNNNLNADKITSIDIINEIEKNIISKEKNTNANNNEKIEIKKGDWNTKDIVEIKDTKNTEINKTGSKFKITTKEDNNSKKIEQLRQIAYKAIQKQEYEIAIKYYKEILKIDPNDNLSKLSLATSYHALKQYEQAKPIYVELMSIFPENQNIVSNLISIIINESPHEAVYLVPSIAEKYEKSAPIQAQTSVAFAKVKNYDEAINYMRKALFLDKNNLDYLYNLAVMYDLNQNYDKALNLYKKIVDKIDNSNIVRKNNVLQRIRILSKQL